MIVDGTLVQVFATVLSGIIIFLTLERRFEGKDTLDLFDRAAKRREDLLSKVSYLEAETDRMNQTRQRNIEFGMSYSEDNSREFENQMNALRNQMDGIRSELKRVELVQAKKVDVYTLVV